jgi:restriction system protein
MAFVLTNNYYYYLIRQIIDDKKITQFKLYNVSEETISMIVDVIPGTVTVYIYNAEDNSRIDLTSDLGKIESINIDDYKFAVSLHFYSNQINFQEGSIFLNNIIMNQSNIDKIKSLDKKFSFSRRFGEKGSYEYIFYKLTNMDYKFSNQSKEYISLQNIKHDSTTNKGNEYEKFIGKKYESLNKNVVYYGLENGKKDNGIDLIIEDEKNITFVQCKNWVSNDHYKINQKDLRAFIGDCYMYILNNNINKTHHFHFIVSDEKLLTISAELYLKENRKLKYKVIPFE